MKLKELKELLNKFDEDLEVYLASDPEGNSYYKFSNVPAIGYVENPDYFLFKVHFNKELTEDLIEQGYTEEDLAGENDVPVLII